MLILENNLVIIAFIPRSGSNYLCDMLLRTGGLGRPLEYYFPYDYDERVERWHNRRKRDNLISINRKLVGTKEKWFLEIIKKRAMKCTWDAHKTMIEEVEHLTKQISIKYIYLKRKDKLRQAISWYRAEFSEQWTSFDIKHPDPPYSKAEIDLRLKWINDQENKWEQYLKNIPHLKLLYENLGQDTIKQYEEYTGMRRRKNRDVDSEHKIMRDELTEEWVKRYQREVDND